MTIIEEIRDLGRICDVGGDESMRNALYRLSDRLANSGALVPIKDGEAGEWTSCGTDDFIKDGAVYCYINGIDRHLNLKSKRTYLVEDNDFVQPVRLVPVTEAEI